MTAAPASACLKGRNSCIKRVDKIAMKDRVNLHHRVGLRNLTKLEIKGEYQVLAKEYVATTVRRLGMCSIDYL